MTATPGEEGVGGLTPKGLTTLSDTAAEALANYEVSLKLGSLPREEKQRYEQARENYVSDNAL